MTTPPIEEVVTINQACAIAKVSRRCIYLWLNANKLRYFRTPSGSVRIVLASLLRPGNSKEERTDGDN
jgi:predicted site-specific integrase-resolvase